MALKLAEASFCSDGTPLGLRHLILRLEYEYEGLWRFIYQFVMHAYVFDLKKLAQFS
jgi:hypothetical protein